VHRNNEHGFFYLLADNVPFIIYELSDGTFQIFIPYSFIESIPVDLYLIKEFAERLLSVILQIKAIPTLN
jgi:hypothetical protein